MGKIKHFKSKSAYERFDAYIHMHDIHTNKNVKYVYIQGKKHKIKRPNMNAF